MKLFEGIELGDLRLDHRVVLAPLTRMRGDRDTLVPQDMSAEYYAQRATKGGLLITEATLISSEGILDHNVPGIWTNAQVEGWKRICDAIHREGGLVSCQLWHTGRAAHGSFAKHPMAKTPHLPTISASDVPIPTKTRSTLTGEKLPYSVPRPLGEDEIPRLLNDYKLAAENCKKAGFDAIEIHAAHGYLLDQFLNDGTNKRTDKYGGSIENRSRLLFEVLETVLKVYPASRVGVRISPHAKGTLKYYATEDSNPDELYAFVISKLDNFKLAYLLLSEPRWSGKYDGDQGNDPGFSMGLLNPGKFRHLYHGKIIGAGGFTPSTAEETVQKNLYDAIAFGRWFISNPDLPKRIRDRLPLNKYDRSTFYAQGSPKGYIDYPKYEDVKDKSVLIPQDKIGKSLAASKL